MREPGFVDFLSFVFKPIGDKAIKMLGIDRDISWCSNYVNELAKACDWKNYGEQTEGEGMKLEQVKEGQKVKVFTTDGYNEMIGTVTGIVDGQVRVMLELGSTEKRLAIVHPRQLDLVEQYYSEHELVMGKLGHLNSNLVSLENSNNKQFDSAHQRITLLEDNIANRIFFVVVQIFLMAAAIIYFCHR